MTIATFVGAGAHRTLCLLLLITFVMLLRSADAASSNGPLAKVGPELQALYDAYRAARTQGLPLVLPDSSLQVVEDRVTIDAVASGPVEDLKNRLIALGMQGAVSAGRIVSGQIPIVQIPKMAALSELRFARAAMSTTHGPSGVRKETP